MSSNRHMPARSLISKRLADSAPSTLRCHLRAVADLQLSLIFASAVLRRRKAASRPSRNDRCVGP